MLQTTTNVLFFKCLIISKTLRNFATPKKDNLLKKYKT